MADILKPKRGKHTTIAQINPILMDGEIVFEKLDDGTTGYGLIKMGDGVTPYNDLPYFIKAVTDYIKQSEKGEANGVAPLNENALIDSRFLPGYVDDILEYPTFDDFPEVGEVGKIYVDASSASSCYRWTGTQYVLIAHSIFYTLEKQDSSIILKGSDGSESVVSNVGGVEIRTDDPAPEDLYPGKLWVVMNE